jgi:phenylpyruvate tautomerase PptA (4-oxalocrotonate tautomerase family)
MPFTTIEMHQGAYTPAQRQDISNALHDAMIEALAVPVDDRLHFFHELPEGSIFHDDTIFGRPRSSRLMFVTFSFNVRRAETKQALFDCAVRHLDKTAGVHEDEVVFRVLETAKENWWGSGRTVDPVTGYDSRMTVVE